MFATACYKTPIHRVNRVDDMLCGANRPGKIYRICYLCIKFAICTAATLIDW